MTRIFRNSLLILPLLFASIAPPAVHAIAAQDSAISWRMQSDDFADRGFSSGFELFYAGPEWFLNALSNPRSRNPFIKSFIIDSAGDRLGAENGYVGTLRDVFDVGLFSNVAMFGATSGTSKTTTPTALDVTNAILFWDADGATSAATGGSGSWLGTATWRLTTSTGGLQTWNDGNTASFGGTAGTVTVNGNVSATNLVFSAGGYTVSGGNSITLTSATGGAGTQAIQTTSAGTTTISAPIILGAASGATQTFSVGSGSTLAISGNITEANTGVNLSKTASGTLTFSGTNSYTGTTAVMAGTLLVNGNQSTATGVVTVSNTGTLGGTGTVGGAVNINSGATITGATNGTTGALTLSNNLTFGGTAANLSTYLVDLTSTASDTLTIGGILNLSTAFDQITFQGTAGAASYSLATYSSRSGLLDTFNTVTNLPSGYELVYGPTELLLVMTPIPEPSTWIGAALALGAIGVMSRKRFTKRSRVKG